MHPKLIVHEYNSEHRYPWRMQPRRGAWQRDWNYGASLSAFAHLLEPSGYDLIGVNSSGVNAFWIDRRLRPRSLARRSPSTAVRSADHRPGSIGHPRRNFLQPATNHAIDLSRLAMTDAEIVGLQSRAEGLRGWLLAYLTNHGQDSVSSGGSFPVHLAYSLSRKPNHVVEPVAMAIEPTRSILAHPLLPGERWPVLIEFDLASHDDHWVMPFAVQESIAWSGPLLVEPIRIGAADGVSISSED